MPIHTERNPLKPVTIQREYYRPHEVAARLGISLEQVRRHLRSRKIPGIKLGRTWLVQPEELQRILNLRNNYLNTADDDAE